MRFWVFMGFLGLVFLMGGGSRDDVMSLAILRPACAFFAAYALTVAEPGAIARVRVPLLFLLALGVWMLIQLIPLPPAIWSALPRRAAIAEIDQMIGIAGTWRPISLSPSKTINSLGSLIVPLAGLLLYAVQSNTDRRRILGLLLGFAAASALVGLGQKVSGGSGPLYFYRVTNFGEPVGLFANRNHNAVFLATMLVIAGYFFAERRHHKSSRASQAVPMAVAGVCLLVVAMLLVSGSRAGLLIGALAAALGTALYLLALRQQGDGHHQRARWLHWLPVAGVIGLAVIVGAFLFSNSPSAERLVKLSVNEEVRAQVLPQIVAMAQEQWFLGTGFGSFEHVYRQYEASAVLSENYLNNAHNDWLQWIIEGGLPAILIAMGFAAWFATVVLGHWRNRERYAPQSRMAGMAVVVLLLLLLASGLDYPLRVPSLMVYAVLMVALVADTPEPASRGTSRRR